MITTRVYPPQHKCKGTFNSSSWFSYILFLRKKSFLACGIFSSFLPTFFPRYFQEDFSSSAIFFLARVLPLFYSSATFRLLCLQWHDITLPWFFFLSDQCVFFSWGYFSLEEKNESFLFLLFQEHPAMKITTKKMISTIEENTEFNSKKKVRLLIQFFSSPDLKGTILLWLLPVMWL